MIKIALAGQPNCGKSTIFNLISGLNQHIANYPGVTVDKKSGKFSYEDKEVEVIDLPGTYSFNSYSQEEKVAKEAIIYENPDILVNIIDASNLKRHLYLTFQLLEIGKPMIIVLNMTDVAKRRGLEINSKEMSDLLNCPIIEANGAKGEGKEEILKSIINLYENKKSHEDFKINYELLEPFIEKIQNKIENTNEISPRWLSIKALEGDEIVKKILKDEKTNESISKIRQDFFDKYEQKAEYFLASTRYNSSEIIYQKVVQKKKKSQKNVTDIADNIVLNKWLSFPILLAIIYAIYELSIVFGYKLTDYTWPLLASFKNFVIDILPEPYITQVPLLTDFGIWMVNSANALLNYIPIFFILFALIAILEDVGYMPRIAFILDRIFRKFGLHGQSTLPLVLGGAFVGGCAVPGVMSTKGIADDRARMATILTVPLMNCLAKVPFYTLLLGAFFSQHMTLMMFYISTITIFTALLIAKLLTSTVLKSREVAPFVMELPPYHLPTFKGVIIRATQRVWQYMKKVVTIVLAVAIILFTLLQFPPLSSQKEELYAKKTEQMLAKFQKMSKKSKYFDEVNSKDKISSLLNYYDSYKSQKMIASSKEAGKKIDENFKLKNLKFFKFVKPLKDKEAKKINKALRKLSKTRNRILRNIKNEKIEKSLLGMTGRFMEPISKYAGFDWKINVAFLSSFAARESAVATLGSLYENNKADNKRAEVAMAENSGYTPLHATAIIIFMLLTPPCIATMIVVKLQTNSYKWMSFAIFFPITLGVIISASIFSLGNAFNWSGLEAMSIYYFIVLILVLIIGIMPKKLTNWSGGFKTTTS